MGIKIFRKDTVKRSISVEDYYKKLKFKPERFINIGSDIENIDDDRAYIENHKISELQKGDYIFFERSDFSRFVKEQIFTVGKKYDILGKYSNRTLGNDRFEIEDDNGDYQLVDITNPYGYWAKS